MSRKKKRTWRQQTPFFRWPKLSPCFLHQITTPMPTISLVGNGQSSLTGEKIYFVLIGMMKLRRNMTIEEENYFNMFIVILSIVGLLQLYTMFNMIIVYVGKFIDDYTSTFTLFFSWKKFCFVLIFYFFINEWKN